MLSHKNTKSTSMFFVTKLRSCCLFLSLCGRYVRAVPPNERIPNYMRLLSSATSVTNKSRHAVSVSRTTTAPSNPGHNSLPAVVSSTGITTYENFDLHTSLKLILLAATTSTTSTRTTAGTRVSKEATTAGGERDAPSSTIPMPGGREGTPAAKQPAPHQFPPSAEGTPKCDPSQLPRVCTYVLPVPDHLP